MKEPLKGCRLVKRGKVVKGDYVCYPNAEFDTVNANWNLAVGCIGDDIVKGVTNYGWRVCRKIKTPKFKEWLIVNDRDANDSFTVEATDSDDAAHKALTELGWWVGKQ